MDPGKHKQIRKRVNGRVGCSRAALAAIEADRYREEFMTGRGDGGGDTTGALFGFEQGALWALPAEGEFNGAGE